MELFLLGDLNCDFSRNASGDSSSLDCKISTLLDIIDIYGLRQLIAEPTKISNTSQTLTDLCITNSLNVIDSGVYHRGLSDHYLVYMTRKS